MATINTDDPDGESTEEPTTGAVRPLAMFAAGVAFAVISILLLWGFPHRHSSSAAPHVEGVAAADCAPWDGAATSIFVSSATSLELLPPAPPYLQLVIYEPGARLDERRIELGRMEGGSGIAVRCQPGGECATSNRGIIDFHAPDPGGALLGDYLITFSDDTMRGSFRARWSSRAAICG